MTGYLRLFVYWIPFLLMLPIVIAVDKFLFSEHRVFQVFCMAPPVALQALILPDIQRYENMVIGTNGMIATSFLGNLCLLIHLNRLDDKFLFATLVSLDLFYVFLGIGCCAIWSELEPIGHTPPRKNWAYEWFFLFTFVLMVPFANFINISLHFYTYLLVLNRYLIRNTEDFELKPMLILRMDEEYKDWRTVLKVNVHIDRDQFYY